LKPVNIRWRLTVPQPPDDAWFFWSKLEHLPLFVPGLLAVRPIDETHHHWSVGESAFEWRSVITDAQPGRRIEWRAVTGSPTLAAGRIEFHQKRKGTATEVRLELWYLAQPSDFPEPQPAGVVHDVVVHEVKDRPVGLIKKRFDAVS